LPVIGVLALQGDVREHLYALEEVGATARPAGRLPEIEACDGLVIPGGSRPRCGVWPRRSGWWTRSASWSPAGSPHPLPI